MPKEILEEKDDEYFDELVEAHKEFLPQFAKEEN